MATNQKGAFLPTTQVWDPGNIENIEASKSLKELLVRMYQNLGAMATMVNYKDTGIYPTEEFVCGQVYFKDPNLDSSTSKTPKLRQVYRKVFIFGDLPNTATKTMAHGIDLGARLMFTRIYGTAKDPVTDRFIPLPFVSPGALAGAIELWVNGANIELTTGSDRTAFTETYIVLEYLKF